MSESKPVHVLQVEDKVRRWLSDFVGSFDGGSRATATFRSGSAQIFVDVIPHTDDDVILKVITMLVGDAPASSELFEWVARENNNYVFGRLAVTDGDEDDTVNVWFEHNLLANYLDQQELEWAVGAVAGTADDLDTKIVDQFGGTLVHADDEG